MQGGEEGNGCRRHEETVVVHANLLTTHSYTDVDSPLPHLLSPTHLDDVLLGCGGGEVAREVGRLPHLPALEVVDDQVDARLGQVTRQTAQHLVGVGGWGEGGGRGAEGSVTGVEWVWGSEGGWTYMGTMGGGGGQSEEGREGEVVHQGQVGRDSKVSRD